MQRNLQAYLSIEYADADGVITNRSITTNFYTTDAYNGGEINAYCHLRNQTRTFYFDRIRRATEADRVNRAIPDLKKYLNTLYSESTQGKAELFFEEHSGAFGALFFIAKSDGAFREKEKIIIDLMCSIFGMTDSAVRAYIVKQMTNWYTPSKVAYGKDLKELLAKPTLYRMRVIAAAKTMINSDKKITEAESAALARMQKILIPKPTKSK
jgi:predicted DNA-binding transcriptional regulator YafY